jgi:hypothetical protein
MADMDVKGGLRSYARDKKAKRHEFLRQQQQDVPRQEGIGKKRYVVDVVLKGNPYGHFRSLWLTCLLGHCLDIDLNVDNYHDHDTAMLLNVKQCVDNTFDYRGGLGKVTEEVFHSTMKQQLKVKRYELKNLMLDGREKPKHIRMDH